MAFRGDGACRRGVWVVQSVLIWRLAGLRARTLGLSEALLVTPLLTEEGGVVAAPFPVAREAHVPGFGA